MKGMEVMCNSNLYKVNIPQTFSKYETSSVIEIGGFSVVVKARDTKTDKFVACKIVSRKGLTENDLFKRFEQELRVQESLDHPNIAKILDILFYDDIIIVVLDYYENGDALAFIEKFGGFGKAELISIIKKIASAIAYIHHKNIAHRDIKLENIVFDRNMNPALIDFGVCTNTSDLRNTVTGSPFYISPEVLFAKTTYDAKAADIWAFGVSCFVLATGSFPWSIENDIKFMKSIRDNNFTIPDTRIEEIDKIIKISIITDVSKRATIDEIEEILNASPIEKITKNQIIRPRINYIRHPNHYSTTKLIFKPSCSSLVKKWQLNQRKTINRFPAKENLIGEFFTTD